MASILKDISDFFSGMRALFTQSDECSDGNTDDKNKDKDPHLKNFDSSKTDARQIASVAFPNGQASSVLEQMATDAVYDATQAQLRLVSMYHKTRKDFYDQSKAATTARKNNTENKQQLCMYFMQLAEEAKKQTSGK